jgi:hypothetical protein
MKEQVVNKCDVPEFVVAISVTEQKMNLENHGKVGK